LRSNSTPQQCTANPYTSTSSKASHRDHDYKNSSILEPAIPNWRNHTPQKPAEIIRDIRNRIRTHNKKTDGAIAPRRFVQRLYQFRSSTPSPTGLLFLSGISEARPLPDKERIHELIAAYRQVHNFQRKLTRLWIAARELMPASYLPAAVQTDARLNDFLPLWDCVLGDWASAAAWHGWHGHITGGRVASLNSQWLIRNQGYQPTGAWQPEVELSPNGSLASAYYSIASSLPIGWSQLCLYQAGRYIKQAIDAQGPTDNLLAIRGSVRLHMVNIPGAIKDFQELVRLRKVPGVSEEKRADALMHLGHAYSLFPFSARGRTLLSASADFYRQHPDHPNLPRVLRKLALAYKLSGRFRLARATLAEAHNEAQRLAAFDQLK
jgi:hypothetical protein